MKLFIPLRYSIWISAANSQEGKETWSKEGRLLALEFPKREEKACSSTSITAGVWDRRGMPVFRSAGVLVDGSSGWACSEHHGGGGLNGNLNLNVKKLLFIIGGISSPSPFVTWSGAVTLLISNK